VPGELPVCPCCAKSTATLTPHADVNRDFSELVDVLKLGGYSFIQAERSETVINPLISHQGMDLADRVAAYLSAVVAATDAIPTHVASTRSLEKCLKSLMFIHADKSVPEMSASDQNSLAKLAKWAELTGRAL
jgi:hypothetical protein